MLNCQYSNFFKSSIYLGAKGFNNLQPISFTGNNSSTSLLSSIIIEKLYAGIGSAREEEFPCAIIKIH